MSAKRSAEMTLVDIFLPAESAFYALAKFGEKSCIQFLDMTPEVLPYNRQYIPEVCRLADMERKLHSIEIEMAKDKIPIIKSKKNSTPLYPSEMNELEDALDKWYEDISEMAAHRVILQKRMIELLELEYVIRNLEPYMGNATIRKEIIMKSDERKGQLTFVTGVVRRDKIFSLEMMLWRITVGNNFYRQASEDLIVEDPVTGCLVRKTAFLVVVQGPGLSETVKKVLEGFKANVHPLPETRKERDDDLFQVQCRIFNLTEVIDRTKMHRCLSLRIIARQYSTWGDRIRLARYVYETMNLFNVDYTKKILVGQGWVPTYRYKDVCDVLTWTTIGLGLDVECFICKRETEEIPPTLQRSDGFTHAIQQIINAYGDATYRELNPAIFSIALFPFLFAIMFGDVGHGIVLMAVAYWMIYYEKQYLKDSGDSEIWNIIFGGRYLIFMMGAFSVYCGFINNDWFSKAVALQRSRFKRELTGLSYKDYPKETMMTPYSAKETSPYIFGLDPLWSLSDKNMILYENSLKMKLSIIFGVFHMTFGIFLSLANYIYFKNYHAIVFNFIPQLIFFLCLFGWLCSMFVIKWLTYSGNTNAVNRSQACAPSILIMFIQMMLLQEPETKEPNCQPLMFEYQKEFQRVLLFIALLCVPILFLGTPVYLNHRYKAKRIVWLNQLTKFRKYLNRDSYTSRQEQAILVKCAKYNVTFAELMLQQGVHSIEFVLSTVSHTASYLRLWALSLAHAKLSEMLWDMILAKMALRHHTYWGAPRLFFIFAVWVILTFFVLVCMEGLSAFLHTLRLHWVEFMSKFYTGEGYPFRPLSFSSFLREESKKPPGCKSKKELKNAKDAKDEEK